MPKNEDFQIFLNQIEAPAFLVEADTVCAMNTAAAQYEIQIDKNIFDLIAIGREEYRSFQSGSLYLTLSCCGVMVDFSVAKLENGNLFVLEQKPVQTDLQLLSLAAKQLSFPLSELSILFERAIENDSTEKEKINKILFQLHRITNNMSDAVQLQNSSPSLQTGELCSITEELLEKTKALLSVTPIEVAYKLPNSAIYAAVSADLLERAIYNLLSNAAKYGTDKIEVTLMRTESKAYLSVSNKRHARHSNADIFSRYKRTPGVEDPSLGLGLGMTLVHAIAKAHGGTVLVETSKDNEIKVTMSISLKPSKNAVVRSPVIKPDIYGGRDLALVELSDVLPAHLYNSKKF